MARHNSTRAAAVSLRRQGTSRAWAGLDDAGAWQLLLGVMGMFRGETGGSRAISQNTKTIELYTF